MSDESDPFATAALRGRVLDAWAASPARFREDANAEEDYALGGYRDRVVVELAQNAADAAARAGVPGRLRLTLREGTLAAANTGAPLDAAGVEALSTLRASSKRGSGAADGAGVANGAGAANPAGAPEATVATVGRFGVGFAAVVAVSDSPSIRSATGAVGWSRERTGLLVAEVPALVEELEARGGHVPVLRLPFGDGDRAEGLPPAGFTTSVELPLRDQAAVGLVARLLAETGPALLLALPALAEIEIETGGATRVLTAVRADGLMTITDGDVGGGGGVSRWRVAADGGILDPDLLADRPVEERARTAWSVRWAVPVDADGGPIALPSDGVSPVVHAPTPTDEPLGRPALLLASFPLSPDRRQVAPGPLTDFLVERAADVYAAMLPELAPGPGLLDLVPGPVGRGELDARLARAIVSRLPDVAFLPAAETAADAAADRAAGLAADAAADAAQAPRIRPRDAVLLAGGGPALAEWLAPVLPGLITGPTRHPAFAVLAVRRLPLAELADLLASLDREPAWWRGLYTALAGAPAEELAELGALPVPLADGRLVRGPRGLLLPGSGLEHPDRLAVLGLRVVAPEAAHPLLVRLGGFEATPRTVLEDAATRAAVAASYDAAVEAGYDDDRPERVADAVLGLVAALDAEPGDYPYLADLALPGDDGDWYPAGELLLPGSPLAEVIAADAPFGTVDQAAVERHGARALAAAGVLSSFGLVRAEDVELEESAVDLDLDGADDWAADSAAMLGDPELPPVALEFTAVRDLDLVDPDRWPRALELLLRPPLRAAVLDRTRVRLADGRHVDVPSYTAWWLRRNLVLEGRRPGDLRAPDSDSLLAGLYDPVATGPGDDPIGRLLADPVLARALGVRTSLADLLAEPGGPDELMVRLADPARTVSRPQLRALWAALATADALAPDAVTPVAVAPTDRVRAVRGDQVVLAEADDVLVLDAPDLWPLLADEPLVLAPYQLAGRLASLLDLPLASEEIAGSLDAESLESAERRPVPTVVAAVMPDAPSHYLAHDKLTVDGIELPWRYLDGEIHAATPAGLGCALAWRAGRWTLRHLLTALLADPDGADRVLADADLDPS